MFGTCLPKTSRLLQMENQFLPAVTLQLGWWSFSHFLSLFVSTSSTSRSLSRPCRATSMETWFIGEEVEWILGILAMLEISLTSSMTQSIKFILFYPNAFSDQSMKHIRLNFTNRIRPTKNKLNMNFSFFWPNDRPSIRYFISIT